VLYERYFGEVTPVTKLPSFSVAKSIVSTLVGIALYESKIKSLQEQVTNYLPPLRKNDERFDVVTIQHVLDMRSGVKSGENYANPFSDVLKMGFARNLSKPALKTKLEKMPGGFDYKSVNTQILALIVEKATGKKLQDYASEKRWQQLQIEHETTWNQDKEGMVRAFCCINAAARDYAKFGASFAPWYLAG
jgi:CubicO group peptidase (beta-lactamase class C family)